MPAHEWTPDDVFEVWADERVRQILVATDGASLSVNELAEACEGSLSSIYRRVEVLSALGLLEDDVEIDERGHHYSVYEAAFEEFSVRLAGEGLVAELSDGKLEPEVLEEFSPGEE